MKCKVCNSKYIDEINTRLKAREFNGETLQDISRDYRKISYSSLQRHVNNCLNGADKPPVDEFEDDELDVELEDLREEALVHYKKAIASGDVKLADSALGHLVKIEDLIARRDDRAIASGKSDEVIEIELQWADGTPTDYNPNYNPDYNPELSPPDPMADIVDAPDIGDPSIGDYKRLALEARPAEMVYDDEGRTIGVRTEAGFIPRQKEPLPLSPPRTVDADFEDIDLSDGEMHRMPDGSYRQDETAYQRKKERERMPATIFLECFQHER